jgi:hypothetical protein
MILSDSRLPQARTADLLVRDLPGGELMVYDTQRHQAHTLNRTAALVWRHCDGESETTAVAARLQQELGLPAEEVVVSLALSHLQKAHLLHGAAVVETTGISRRAVMRKLGMAGGVTLALLPLVASMAAPAAAWQVSVSCLSEYDQCDNSALPCCDGFVCGPNPSAGENFYCVDAV